MAKKKGGVGPGAGIMGGAGARPGRMPTPMAGRPPPGPVGGLPGGPMGMAGAGGPPRAPRPLPAPGGQAVARSPAAGMGGAAGFAKGGVAETLKEEEKEGLAHGGPVGEHGHRAKPIDYPRHSERDREDEHRQKRDARPHHRHGEMSRQISEGKAGFRKGGHTAFAHGGPVFSGADSKSRVGRDTGKASKSD